MKTYQLILIAFFVLSILLFGCAKKKPIYETDKRTPGDLPVLDKQIDDDEHSVDIISLTEDLIYPGSEPYEDAKYDYLADESPAKVAHWFEGNFEGCKVKKVSANLPENAKWIITLDSLIVEVLQGPERKNTLIRYKKDIYYEKDSE